MRRAERKRKRQRHRNADPVANHQGTPKGGVVGEKGFCALAGGVEGRVVKLLPEAGEVGARCLRSLGAARLPGV